MFRVYSDRVSVLCQMDTSKRKVFLLKSKVNVLKAYR